MKRVEREFQKLEDMKDYWKDKTQKCYEALVQEWELLGHIGDGIVKVQKDLDNLHGRSLTLMKLMGRYNKVTENSMKS